MHQISAVTESSFVRATLSGLQRRLARPKVKKEPLLSLGAHAQRGLQ